MFHQTHLGMARAQTLLLIGCLLQGVLCQDWRATVPQRIEALSGTCVTTPCSFTIDEKYRKDLNAECHGVWIKDNLGGMTVYDSSQPNSKGNITGDLTQNNCTSVLNDIPAAGSGKYYFSIQCNNDLKWNFKNMSVQIRVQASPPKPSLTPSSVNVKEGTSVSLTCSAAVLCPTLPPSLTWTPSLGDSQENTVQTNIMTSVLTFTVSHLHHRMRISCTALYQQQTGTKLSATTSLIINVLYAPRNTSISVSFRGPVLEGSSVTLTCSSDANPAVDNYTWYRVYEGNTLLVGSGKRYDISNINKDQGAFFCVAENKLGREQSVKSDILNTKKCENVLIPYILLLSVMVCLCVMTVGICVFKINQLSMKLKENRHQGTTGDTYASLDLSTVTPVYDTLHHRSGQ